MSKNNVNGGIGLTGLLTIAFIVLKLCRMTGSDSRPCYS